MEVNRAKEIAESPDIQVISYLGIPVFIESVNMEAGTAIIHTLDSPDEEQSVPLDVLEEEFNDEVDLPFI
ncbi:H-type small acid-soluble spore protein [Paenibacillus glycanilyticus]|uniref:H-type small acid-soluble spore protein n=1 Tax=Paenibacillus glycanilyticus TaxID=126569 RepID=A0ABQ6GD72_9BACL|nr:H-type small acid-soluble spore protein [Paenibacillus glycanilyticus]GLX67577.1 hypothetical protein MU1_19220 [Paenibacillus glycanilyticus]